jgi:hypothetical protein
MALNSKGLVILVWILVALLMAELGVASYVTHKLLRDNMHLKLKLDYYERQPGIKRLPDLSDEELGLK